MKRKSTKLLWGILAFFFALLLTALLWNIKGRYELGRIIGPESARDFRELVIKGDWKVEIVQRESFGLELDYGVLPDIYVDLGEGRYGGTTLVFARAGGFLNLFSNSSEQDRPRATVYMPDLEKVGMSGISEVKFSGFDEQNIRLELSGATRIKVEDSETENLNLEVTGASHAELLGLEVKNAIVKLSGASSAELQMMGGQLNGRLTGVSTLAYGGKVSKESILTTGEASKVHYEN